MIDFDALAESIRTSLKDAADELEIAYTVAQKTHDLAQRSETGTMERIAAKAIFSAVEDATGGIMQTIRTLNGVVSTLVQATKTDGEETDD